MEREIIKERIDNFELNIDNERGIVIIGCIPGISSELLQDAIRQLQECTVCISSSFSEAIKSIELQQVVIQENNIPILKEKIHNQHGWYRKFEKKKR